MPLSGLKVLEPRLAGQAVNLSRTPEHVNTASSDPGEHTVAILTELGYTAEDVAQFRADGVV